MTHPAADMSMVQSQSEGLGEGVSRINDPGNVGENNLATGFPLLNCKKLDVDVTRPGSRATSVDREDCGSVVFVQGGSSDWGYPSSESMERRYLAILAACTAAINSASVELVETVDWILDLYAMGPPQNMKTRPVIDRRVMRSEA